MKDKRLREICDRLEVLTQDLDSHMVRIEAILKQLEMQNHSKHQLNKEKTGQDT